MTASPSSAGTLRVMGMISGTSHDGIDVVIVELTAGRPDTLTLRVVGGDSTPYPAELRTRLVAALPPAAASFAEVCELDTLIGRRFAHAAAAAITRWGPVDLICSHGQTVYHWIADDGGCLGTLQIGQPAWIAERTGAPVWSDVRIRDITVGGQGAPLVPILDALLIGDRTGVAALNLGGIANASYRVGDELLAHDIGPANALIDAVVTERGLDPAGYDTAGRIAASGTVDQTLLDQLLTEPYYAKPAPKSTGKELFHLGYVHDHLARLGGPPSAADLVATLTALTARTVGDELVRLGITEVIVSGGGVANPTLMRMLAEAAPGVTIGTTDDHGIPADLKEAVAFALIGWHSHHGLPGAVISATGAREPRVLGTLTPGAPPLLLPAPLPTAPSHLEVVEP